MNNQSHIYHSDAYLQFKELDRTSLRSIIYYFEKNIESLHQLEIREFFEILVTYGNAVFEMGAYRKFIDISDEIIFLCIEHNIYEFEGEDIYCSTLFKKAAAHYNIEQTTQAEYILEQTMRIYPENKYVVKFYKKILTGQRKITSKTRAIAILMILTSAFVIALELLVIRPFYEEWASAVEWMRYSLLSLGVGIYLLGELINFIKTERKVKRKIREIRYKKQINP